MTPLTRTPTYDTHIHTHTHTPQAAPRAPAAAAWAAAALILTAAGPAAAGGDVTIGAKIFSNTCAACHTGGQNIVEADKTLEKEALEQYLDGGFSEASIIRQVRVVEGGGAGGVQPSTRPPIPSGLAARLQKTLVLPEPGRQLKAWRPLLEAQERAGGRVVVA